MEVLSCICVSHQTYSFNHYTIIICCAAEAGCMAAGKDFRMIVDMMAWIFILWTVF